MQIGDRFGTGVIVDMEKDMDAPVFWIRVQYENHANQINFTTSHRNLMAKPKDTTRFSHEEYYAIDMKYKAMREENIMLKAQVEVLEEALRNRKCNCQSKVI